MPLMEGSVRMSSFKNIINRFFGLAGYRLSKVRNQSSRQEYEFLDGIFEVLQSQLGGVNIVQIGANDGKHEDPIYRYAFRYPKCTKILLVEPQPEIVKKLRENYHGHNSATIMECAVSTKEISLYRIKPEVWHLSKTSRGRPSYVKASGITSASYEHVLKRATRYLPRSLRGDIHLYIEEIKPRVLDLMSLLSDAKFEEAVHILSVDAEGFDDDVIYASNIEQLMPKVINCEYEHLSEVRQKALKSYLENLGYVVIRYKQSDIVALKRWAGIN